MVYVWFKFTIFVHDQIESPVHALPLRARRRCMAAESVRTFSHPYIRRCESTGQAVMLPPPVVSNAGRMTPDQNGTASGSAAQALIRPLLQPAPSLLPDTFVEKPVIGNAIICNPCYLPLISCTNVLFLCSAPFAEEEYIGNPPPFSDVCAVP